ncbi:flagellar hook protein FlgE [Algihabitans albus]|uniref:flagellar hook protein FlgE n=1 Tax=Algihabitans albus TaxID=2164067 RepID=UPI000E5D9331|nr:flagellar hook protein FlgE [Algihabitans albus]
MSIYGAMFSGVSALSAQSNALGMISDNISNVNTVGYKGTSAAFATLVTESATRSQFTPGGVRSMPMSNVDRQGLLQGSANTTDLAIAGRGFFVVNEAANPGPGNEVLFTRAGNFRPDAEGNLRNAAGYYLQGWPLDANGTPIGNTSVLSSVETVNIGNLSGAARATQNIELDMNLPSNAVAGDTHDVTVQIYDSLGNAHDLTLEFEKTVANDWDVSITGMLQSGTTTDSLTAAGMTALTAYVGNITFAGNGSPATITLPNIAITGFVSGADNSNIAIDGGTAGQNNGIVQFGGDFFLRNIDQDGVRFGEFSGVAISEDGVVTALFDNGDRQEIYQLPIAMFANVNGMEARDGNAYQQTDRSGELVLATANSGGAGRVAASALESSTVDLANEFTDMIITQRAYSAGTKVITTADEMLEELIRIRR